MYGMAVRGPLTILKELWSEEIPDEEVKSTYQYVLDLQEKLESTCRVAKTELESSSRKYKKHFDVKAKERRFECGDRALLLLPTSSNKLLMQWRGPYEVVGNVARHNYSLQVGKKRKTYHANLMKRYVERSSEEQGDDVTHGDNDVEDDDDHEVEEPSLMVGNAIQVIDDNDSYNNDSIVGLSFPSLQQTEVR